MSANRSYLTLEGEVHPGAKTVVMHVNSRTRGDRLGTIRWHGAWRQYIFEPEGFTIWSGGCLEELHHFLKGANDEHRTQLRHAAKGK